MLQKFTSFCRSFALHFNSLMDVWSERRRKNFSSLGLFKLLTRENTHTQTQTHRHKTENVKRTRKTLALTATDRRKRAHCTHDKLCGIFVFAPVQYYEWFDNEDCQNFSMNFCADTQNDMIFWCFSSARFIRVEHAKCAVSMTMGNTEMCWDLHKMNESIRKLSEICRNVCSFFPFTRKTGERFDCFSPRFLICSNIVFFFCSFCFISFTGCKQNVVQNAHKITKIRTVRKPHAMFKMKRKRTNER